ncbi:MAG: VOC family protein [Candidatus Binatus sp.]|uniref:VOC family protein n=1 Tax=Candidatus Binatus sp. TaxID=2811406 RepID=UPI002717CDF6|nr:VOC family protein [Candidatus Binatus sp.]MDO8431162.1 VOC family protein [Candidatus Binatus sp.]
MWLRLRQLALVANKLSPVIDELRTVFGLEVGYRDPGVKVFGLENALLPVGSQFIEIVAPIQPNTAGGRYLERRGGDGGYMVITQCDDHAPRKRRVAELGIRKVMEEDSPGYCAMQLHPRDTGGSFLEIDFQPGGEAPDGPWAPAGKNWKQAVRTEVVKAITAAEIQSPDRNALAARWSEIVEIPLTQDARGNPTLQLENAKLRFVDATDGRGEGLGGIELAVVDRKRLLAAAEKIHRRISDDQVMIAGIRFTFA